MNCREKTQKRLKGTEWHQSFLVAPKESLSNIEKSLITNSSCVMASGLGFLCFDFLMNVGKMVQSHRTLTNEWNYYLNGLYFSA